MQQRLQSTVALLAGVLILGLPMLGFLHAIVPHQHVHAGAEHTELQGWLGGLSSRKEFSGLFVGIIFIVGFTFALNLRGMFVPMAAYARRTHFDPQEEALHRGRVAYRAFR